MAHDPTTLPPNLPRPTDDGAADHLRGAEIPALELPSTLGGAVDLARITRSPAVLFFYPRTGATYAGDSAQRASAEFDELAALEG